MCRTWSETPKTGILAPRLKCVLLASVALQAGINLGCLRNQWTNGPVNAHLISWPSKAQNIQNLEKYMVKK